MDVTQKIWKGIQKNSPKICAGIAIFGVCTTAVLAVRGTPKALLLIEEKKAELNKPVLTKKETVSAVWRNYIPAVTSGVLTIASIITGHSIQLQRNAQLIVAYGASQSALRLYSDLVAKQIGAEQEQLLRQQLTIETMHAAPVPTGKRIPMDLTIETESDPKDKICEWYDYFGDRYFYDSQRTVLNAIDAFNESMSTGEGYGNLNELYSHFQNEDLKPTTTGDLLGWTYKDGQGAVPMFTYDKDKFGNPCIILDFYNPPQYGYDSPFA